MNAHALLLARAADPRDGATLALAGVIATALERHGPSWLPLPGLDARATRELMAERFPGADAALGLDWRTVAERDEPRRDEIDDLAALLRAHADTAAGTPDAIDAVAHALACGSLGNNHLWQDLRLPARHALSALIARWFPALAARNTQDMKWKKFFYKQLCEQEQISICKAPSCAVCCDHALCFGPEDAAVPA